MSDKRFTFYYERGNEVVFKDNGQRISNKQLVDLLNEQQVVIERLKEENKKLKKRLKKCANNWKQEIVERGKLEQETMIMSD